MLSRTKSSLKREVVNGNNFIYGRMVEHMTKSEKAIEKASKQARELEKKYNAPVIWMGGNKFIVVKDDKEIEVEV